MKRTLAGLALIVVVAAAGVWAVASMVPPTSAPAREPALVVPAGSASPQATIEPASPTPSGSASPTPSVAPSSKSSAPGTVSAPQPSYYDDDDHDDDKGGDRDTDDDKDDDD